MTEHGVPDGRRTIRTKGISHTLPLDHKVAPDARHKGSRVLGGQYAPAPDTGDPQAPDVAASAIPEPIPAKPPTKRKKRKLRRPD
jgi:hypothetical protein